MMYKLSDLFAKPISGEWGIEPNQNTGIGVIRSTNFTNIGKLNIEAGIVLRDIQTKKINEKKLRYGDIIIEKSGGSPNQPVGRVVFFDISEGTYLCSNFTSILRPNPSMFPKYCLYLMLYLHYTGRVLKYQNKTTGIINLKLNDYLNDTEIPLPPLEAQKKIAHVLDKAQELIDIRKKQIELLDDFLQSVFIDMFGDPVKNPKGWRVRLLGQIACDFKYGTNQKAIENPNKSSIPVLRIPNITSRRIDLTDLKYIVIDKEEVSKLLLESGDLLFVRSNGNPDYIGRCAIYDLDVKSVYASYLIRVRIDSQEEVNLTYLCYMFSYPSYRVKLKKESKTTAGNYNINTNGLKSLQVILPPLDLQNKFAEIVQAAEKQRELKKKSLTEMENNFNSIMQKTFQGKIF